jgi:hypothetical protein
MRTKTRAVLAACAASGLLTALAPLTPAGADTVKATLVKTIKTSSFNPAAPDPAGIAWMPSPSGSGGNLVIVDSEVDEMSIYKGVNMWMFSTGGSVSQTGNTRAYSKEPTGVAYDPVERTLYVSDDDTKKITILKAGSDGKFGTTDDPKSTYMATDAGDSDPEGVAVDSTNGDLYLAGGITKAFYRVQRGSDGKLGTSDDIERKFDLSKYGLKDNEGVAYDQARQRVVAFCQDTKRLYELDRSGNLLRIVDISAVSPKTGGDVTIAPASSGGGMHYYIAMRGVDNDSDASENDGKVYEISVPGDTPPPPANDAPVVTLTSPAGGSYPSNSELTLAGSATDTEDKPLTSQLSWTSNLSGPLGTGTGLNVILEDGLHEITASITDSGGRTGSASVSVQIGPVPPTPTPVTFFAEDASLLSGSPSTNYGSAQTVETDNNKPSHFLLRFDVQGITGKTVNDVRIVLTCVNSSNKGGDFRAELTNLWKENEVTWNTRPSFDKDATPLASLGSVSSGKSYEVKLPAGYITKDGSYSLIVTTTSDDGADYYSSEKGGTQQPQLVVTVTPSSEPPPTTPTSSTPESTSPTTPESTSPGTPPTTPESTSPTTAEPTTAGTPPPSSEPVSPTS